MTDLYLASVFAQTSDGWGHHWWGPGGGPWLFGPLFGLLWIVLIVGTIVFVARGGRFRERSGPERARDVLAERYARGEIATAEFRERIEQLRGQS